MGGNIFDHNSEIKIRRLTPIEYEKVKSDVLELLRPYCQAFKVPQHIKSKESFGDVDVLYVLDESQIKFKDFLTHMETSLNSLEKIGINTNYNYSFHYNLDGLEAQIDLIHYNTLEELNFANFYMSHSDFGSILGQICSCQGLTISDTRLYIKVFYDDNPAKILGTIDLASTPEEVCEYFGLNHDVLKSQFLSEHEFFDFMSSAPNFNPNFFAFRESFNCTHRKRATKRPVYIRFMEFVADKFKENSCQFETIESFKQKRAQNKESAAKQFKKYKEYCKFQSDYEKAQIVKVKFNGNVVKQIIPEFFVKMREKKTNGKFLGEFMDIVREEISADEFLVIRDDDLKMKILELYAIFSKTVDW